MSKDDLDKGRKFDPKLTLEEIRIAKELAGKAWDEASSHGEAFRPGEGVVHIPKVSRDKYVDRIWFGYVKNARAAIRARGDDDAT